jgi:hypothetical protein
MASWTTARFGSAKKMIEYLNGTVLGKINLKNGADVDGLTFIFDKGAGSVAVTFAPPKSRPWVLTEIVAQINATEVDLAHINNVGGLDRRLAIEKDLASLTIKSTGTANALLGFSTVADQISNRVADTEVYSAAPEPGEQSWIVVRYA